MAIDQYEVRATTPDCNSVPQYVHADGVYNTWINLASVHPGWGISAFTPDYSFGCQITIQIRKAATGQIVATGVVTGSAWTEQ
jgi:hypothetical protein